MVSWEERNVKIAKLIPPGSVVLDLGAGDLSLLRNLVRCYYVGYDINPTSPNVQKCDFNTETPDTWKADYVVISGVLEYLNDPINFINRVVGLGDKMIVTYSPADGHTKEDRERSKWVNHLTRKEFEDNLFRYNLKFVQETNWNEQIVGFIEKV